jgi:DNA primase
MSIPYLRPTTDDELFVASIRFRCLVEGCEHEFHGKYNTVAGDRPRMFNTKALVESDDIIAICEGELDAITAQACGIPAVGIPGIQLWKRAFREPFLGYEKVYILADGDDAGRQLATVLMKDLGANGVVVPMPHGEDVNSFVKKNGPKALRERIN